MHMLKQCHILPPNPIRAGHKGVISEGGGYFLQIKAIFVWRSLPRRYKEVKLSGFSIIMSRDWEGIIFLFKAGMGVKCITVCFICMILHSHLYLEDCPSAYWDCCHSFIHLLIFDSFFSSLALSVLSFLPPCFSNSFSYYLVHWAFRWIHLCGSNSCRHASDFLAHKTVSFEKTVASSVYDSWFSSSFVAHGTLAGHSPTWHLPCVIITDGSFSV